jgi:hypothetical protein
VRSILALVLLSGASCAALKTGWAQVTWTDGRVSPAASCTARVGPEGDVLMVCRPLSEVETDLLWKSERTRTATGEI